MGRIAKLKCILGGVGCGVSGFYLVGIWLCGRWWKVIGDNVGAVVVAVVVTAFLGGQF